MPKNKILELGKDGLQKLIDESNSYADILRSLNMHTHGSSYQVLKKAIKDLKVDVEDLEKRSEEQNLNTIKDLQPNNRIPLEEIFAGNHQGYSTTKLKNRLIKEGYKECKCENCGLTEWCGSPIPLQLHHVDGNRNNNELKNLQLLCPNCHAMTDNFAGKNIKKTRKDNKNKNKKDLCPICNINFKNKDAEMCLDCYKEKRSKRRKDIDRETLKNEIRIYPMTSVAEIHRVTDNAVRKWCKKYNLPHKSREIKKISNEDWSKI